jgi:hypothetical protein
MGILIHLRDSSRDSLSTLEQTRAEKSYQTMKDSSSAFALEPQGGILIGRRPFGKLELRNPVRPRRIPAVLSRSSHKEGSR